MASRSKTDLKREAMKSSLRQRCAAGDISASRPLPGLRELASEFGLSKDVASLALRDLVDEGLLYTLPRVGTFVRETRTARGELFVMISHIQPSAPHGNSGLKRGFEDAIAEVGATPLVLEGEAFEAALLGGELGQVAGIFDMATAANGSPFWKSRSAHSQIPCVRIGDDLEFVSGYDLVSFDNVEGGVQATEHLLEQGHRRIAFLGVHQPSKLHPHFIWSQQRELGWSQAMKNAGLQELLEAEALAFHPLEWPAGNVAGHIEGAEEALAAQIALQLAGRSDITAFVAANDRLAIAVMRQIEAQWPAHQWPAVVGFDGDASGRDHLLSSLRLPWDELGRAAGEVLWARHRGELPRAALLRRVSMKLIPRLSCRSKGNAHLTRSRLMVASA